MILRCPDERLEMVLDLEYNTYDSEVHDLAITKNNINCQSVCPLIHFDSLHETK